jgi:hypothetical protein
MGQVQAQFAIIREKKQSFTIEIEPTDGMEMAPLFGKQVVDGSATMFVTFGTDESTRFIEGQVNFSLQTDGFAVYGNAIMEGIDLFTQFGDGHAINGDAAFRDELFAGAPGSHAGIGEELLQTDHGNLIYELGFTNYAREKEARLKRKT